MSPSSMYLKWPRLITFQLTSALSITVVGLASWALKEGIDKRNLVKKTIPGASLNITDAISVGGAVTAAAAVASLLCLIMQVMILFHPHRPETLRTVRMREGAFAFATIFWIATLIPATVIMANRSGVITAPGIPASVITQIVKASGQNLSYKVNTPIKAYIIVGWVTLLSTIVNLILVSLAARHVLKHGHGHDAEKDNFVRTASPGESSVPATGNTSLEKNRDVRI